VQAASAPARPAERPERAQPAVLPRRGAPVVAAAPEEGRASPARTIAIATWHRCAISSAERTVVTRPSASKRPSARQIAPVAVASSIVTMDPSAPTPAQAAVALTTVTAPRAARTPAPVEAASSSATALRVARSTAPAPSTRARSTAKEAPPRPVPETAQRLRARNPPEPQPRQPYSNKYSTLLRGEPVGSTP
jgi:hypothetical protein